MFDENWRQRVIRSLASELDHVESGVEGAIDLLDQGNTLPFIARYRKEATAEMDETKLRKLVRRYEYLGRVRERKCEILNALRNQGALTNRLEEALDAAASIQQLDDLYRPFRPKRKTRASQARARGLTPLAEGMLRGENRNTLLSQWYAENSSEDGDHLDPEDALAGARDIVAEVVAEDIGAREAIRSAIRKSGTLVSEARVDLAGTPYALYGTFRRGLNTVRPHQVLAIDRAERENALRVRIDLDHATASETLANRFVRVDNPWADALGSAVEDGYHRLLFPSIEREIRRGLTEGAESHAISVFAQNLTDLIMAPPIPGRVVLGVDPAYRSGCKLAAVGPRGDVLDVAVVYPHPPQGKEADARSTLAEMIRNWDVDIIAIGNGTASRETEALVAGLIPELRREVSYTIVNEAGASVYSASALAAAELPRLDVSHRGAVSIARRLQDPLAELVKIEPRSIGVGLYQHDVDQKELARSLGEVVESCVNRVGVDANSASPALLTHVAGIRPGVAEAIVAYRRSKGPFVNRKQLLEVPGLGMVTFEQAAGFLRIRGGDDPLDNTWVHPESYPIARDILAHIGASPDALVEQPDWVRKTLENTRPQDIAEVIDAGRPTINDIFAALSRPGRDPRENLPQPILRKDIISLDQVEPGEVLTGTVRNVVDFGVFVDIGVGRDGLVHISELSEGFVRHPGDLLSVGDTVVVRVLSIDRERDRISLSISAV